MTPPTLTDAQQKVLRRELKEYDRDRERLWTTLLSITEMRNVIGAKLGEKHIEPNFFADKPNGTGAVRGKRQKTFAT